MSRETVKAKRARAEEILNRLEEDFGEVHIELDFETPLELLVAVILSAQCTDKRVNMVTPALFRAYPDAAHYARAEPEEIEPYINSLGLFRAKAKSLARLGRMLVEEHDCEVPRTRAELAKLPGVGAKTAGVVTMHLGGEHAFPVDTHVGRLARRMAFTRRLDPDRVEEDLQKLLPSERWMIGHQLLVWHGRRTCTARAPACDRCVVEALCPKVGVVNAKVRTQAAKKRAATGAGAKGRPSRSGAKKGLTMRRVTGEG